MGNGEKIRDLGFGAGDGGLGTRNLKLGTINQINFLCVSVSPWFRIFLGVEIIREDMTHENRIYTVQT